MMNILGLFYYLFLWPSMMAGQPFLLFRCFPGGCRGQASITYSRFGSSFTHEFENIWIPYWHVSYIRELPAQEISPLHLTDVGLFANALQKGRNSKYYTFHCRNMDFESQITAVFHFMCACVKSESIQKENWAGRGSSASTTLVGPCSPVSSGTISGNKRQGGLCRVISAHSVLLSYNLVQNQSRESQEEKQGLSQGREDSTTSTQIMLIAALHRYNPPRFHSEVQPSWALPGAVAGQGCGPCGFLPRTSQGGHLRSLPL